MHKRTTGLVAAALAACAVGTAAVPAAQADDTEQLVCRYQVDVDADSRLRIRDEPSTSAAITGYLPDGFVIRSPRTDGGDWVQDEYGDWLHSDYLIEGNCQPEVL